MDNRDSREKEELAKAHETIARQEAEIRNLRAQVQDQSFAVDLRNALMTASAAGVVASPVSHSRLLEMIVETAAHVISARAATLFLIDEATHELVFEVALGQKAEEVKKFRVPLGHGIAGLVAVTGQAMAVSDAQKDPRQASDIARAVGYSPENILCVPLFYNDQVTGVLELLDKEDSQSFTPADMETLGLFANQAAVAIEQSSTHKNLASLVGEVLDSLGGPQGADSEQLKTGARLFTSHIESDPAYAQALEIARMIQRIVWRGDNELKLCQAILRSFLDYVEAKAANEPGMVM